MKIIADSNIPYLEGRLGDDVELIRMRPDAIDAHLVRDADALVVRTRTRCDASLLQDSKVRLVATATIGTDHIDIPWCRSHGIAVESAPGCNAPAVAQYVWSCLLRLGFDPAKGETLGVVGWGNIGSMVADWGRAFGAEVLVSDPPKERAGIPGNYAPLHEIMRRCRAVTVHTPLTRDGQDPTFHLIGDRELDMTGNNAILINAARGGVVDNQALFRRLERNKDLKVVLDVWEGEPNIDRKLLGMVDYGTFHIAGYSAAGKQRATSMVLDALRRHLGMTPDISGLEPPYDTSRIPTPEQILKSYDPAVDSDQLRNTPEAFESLRSNYVFRPEAL